MNHQGRQFTVQDFNDFDYIVAMDSSNVQNIEKLRPVGRDKQIMLMRSFDEAGLNKDVPDPYYGVENGFQEVFDILDRSIEGLVNHVVLEKGL